MGSRRALVSFGAVLLAGCGAQRAAAPTVTIPPVPPGLAAERPPLVRSEAHRLVLSALACDAGDVWRDAVAASAVKGASPRDHCAEVARWAGVDVESARVRDPAVAAAVRATVARYPVEGDPIAREALLALFDRGTRALDEPAAAREAASRASMTPAPEEEFLPPDRTVSQEITARLADATALQSLWSLRAETGTPVALGLEARALAWIAGGARLELPTRVAVPFKVAAARAPIEVLFGLAAPPPTEAVLTVAQRWDDYVDWAAREVSPLLGTHVPRFEPPAAPTGADAERAYRTLRLAVAAGLLEAARAVGPSELANAAVGEGARLAR
jgi:hypothetical protein